MRIEERKQRILDALENLKECRDYYTASCVTNDHLDENSSMIVNDDPAGLRFKCLGCGASGLMRDMERELFGSSQAGLMPAIIVLVVSN